MPTPTPIITTLNDPTDQTLAHAARAGDPHARNTLYLRHLPMIRNRTISAQRLADKLYASGAPINGDDVRQETFLIFCRFLEIWDPTRTTFVTFLSDSIARASYSYVRTMQHLRSTRTRLISIQTITDLDLLDSTHETDPDPTHAPTTLIDPHLITPDTTENIIHTHHWQFITSGLSSDLALLIHQRYWQDKSSDYIARTTGQSRRTINRALRVALTILKSQASHLQQTG